MLISNLLMPFCAAANVRTVYANLPYDQMHAPIVGPANPNTKNWLAAGLRNHRAGHVEVHYLPLDCVIFE